MVRKINKTNVSSTRNTEYKLAGSAVFSNVLRRRVFTGVVVLLLLGGIATAIVLTNPGKSTATTSSEGMHGKINQCLSDEDCPDGTYCDQEGTCIPNGAGSSFKPQTDIIGRARGGEGTNVHKISIKKQGQ